MIPISSERVQVFNTSDSTQLHVCQICNASVIEKNNIEEPVQTLPNVQVVVGDWVLFSCNGKNNPGEFVLINDKKEV